MAAAIVLRRTQLKKIVMTRNLIDNSVKSNRSNG